MSPFGSVSLFLKVLGVVLIGKNLKSIIQSISHHKPIHVSHCGKGSASIQIDQDSTLGSTLGFDLTREECEARCAALGECRWYSYGRWEKGLSPFFGGHYGQMRCQLYSRCEFGTSRETTALLKPDAHASEKRAQPIWHTFRPHHVYIITFLIVFATYSMAWYIEPLLDSALSTSEVENHVNLAEAENHMNLASTDIGEAALPTESAEVAMQKHAMARWMISPVECAVCFELLQDQAVLLTVCNHAVHLGCVAQAGSSRCPLCRQNMGIGDMVQVAVTAPN